ncbi:hypothetical protein T484DRAFT_1934191 [Baffinella frigidus]|nr:hypothetical protein T484DRAFT_1934191 [Cryptophyta sp. CCMP2293]
MWKLVSEADPSRTRYLPAGKYQLGRTRKPDFVEEDNVEYIDVVEFNPDKGNLKAISRPHVEIEVRPLADVYKKKAQLIFIKDLSKFGVGVTGLDAKCYKQPSASQKETPMPNRILKGAAVPLHHGCTVQLTVTVPLFKLRLERVAVTICHSLLEKAMSKEVERHCAALGIAISPSWSTHCNLLVMQELQMTPKMLLALIDNKEIVTPAYLETMASDPQHALFLTDGTGGARASKSSWRPAAAFIPPPSPLLPDRYWACLSAGEGGEPPVTPERSRLLEGLRFTIPYDQDPAPVRCGSDKEIIEHAGGEATLVCASLLDAAQDCPDAFLIIGPQDEVDPDLWEELDRMGGEGMGVVTSEMLYDAVIFCKVEHLHLQEMTQDDHPPAATEDIPESPPARQASAEAGREGKGARAGAREAAELPPPRAARAEGAFPRAPAGEGAARGKGSSGDKASAAHQADKAPPAQKAPKAGGLPGAQGAGEPGGRRAGAPHNPPGKARDAAAEGGAASAAKAGGSGGVTPGRAPGNAGHDTAKRMAGSSEDGDEWESVDMEGREVPVAGGGEAEPRRSAEEGAAAGGSAPSAVRLGTNFKRFKKGGNAAAGGAVAPPPHPGFGVWPEKLGGVGAGRRRREQEEEDEDDDMMGPSHGAPNKRSHA